MTELFVTALHERYLIEDPADPSETKSLSDNAIPITERIVTALHERYLIEDPADPSENEIIER
jgi:hypothetical protein